MWKDEFFVASLKQFIDSAFDEPVQIMRVIKLNRVEIYKFPLAARPSQFNGLATDDPYMVTDVQRVREPEPSAKQIEHGEVIQSSSAIAVYNPGWLGFLRHVDNQEG